MPRYLLDTNILIAAIKGAPAIRSRLEGIEAQEIALSPVVLGELQLGVEKSRLKAANRLALDSMVGGFVCSPLNEHAARCYGEIRASLESKGQPIGGNDYWIAAQAIAEDLILVTDKIREFRRVAGLKMENWLREDQAPR